MLKERAVLMIFNFLPYLQLLLKQVQYCCNTRLIQPLKGKRKQHYKGYATVMFARR